MYGIEKREVEKESECKAMRRSGVRIEMEVCNWRERIKENQEKKEGRREWNKCERGKRDGGEEFGVGRREGEGRSGFVRLVKIRTRGIAVL